MLYLDVLFVINLVADYLILLTTAKICAVYAPRIRLFSAALLGAVYAVTEAAIGGALSSLLIWLAVAVVMLCIAFGGANKKALPRVGLIFMAASAGFAGVIYAVLHFGGRDPVSAMLSGRWIAVLLCVFAAAYMVFSAVFRRAGRAEAKISKVTLRHNGRSVSFSALRDTGNSLSDPLTGKYMIVIDAATVGLLFMGDARRILTGFDGCDPVSLAEKLAAAGTAFRLVPYRAVGTDIGLLPAFLPERVTVDGADRRDLLVAVSPNEVGDGGTYSALMSAA